MKNLEAVKNARLCRIEQEIESAEKYLLEYQNAADIAELAARAIKRDAVDIEHWQENKNSDLTI
jgi:hypothetical protein